MDVTQWNALKIYNDGREKCMHTTIFQLHIEIYVVHKVRALCRKRKETRKKTRTRATMDSLVGSCSLSLSPSPWHNHSPFVLSLFVRSLSFSLIRCTIAALESSNMFEGPPMNPCARALALLCRNKMGQTFAQSGPYVHCSCIKSVLYSLFNARKMCNNEISMQNDAKDARSVFLRFA